MQSRLRWGALVAAAAFVLALGSVRGADSRAGAAAEFRYKVLKRETLMFMGASDSMARPEVKIQRGLDKLGDEGWELISVEGETFYLIKR